MPSLQETPSQVTLEPYNAQLFKPQEESNPHHSVSDDVFVFSAEMSGLFHFECQKSN